MLACRQLSRAHSKSNLGNATSECVHITLRYGLAQQVSAQFCARTCTPLCALLTLLPVLVLQAASRVCSSATYSLIATATHATPQSSTPRMVGLVTATQRAGDKRLMWQRSIASAGPAELLNIDMAEARAEQHDSSVQEASEASRALVPVDSRLQATNHLPFGALVLLDGGSLIACSMETAQAMLACVEHGCSAELHGKLTQSPAPRNPWQPAHAGACSLDEHVRLGPSKHSRNVQGGSHAGAVTWQHVVAVLSALCCMSLIALLVLFRCCAAAPARRAATQPRMLAAPKSAALYHTPCAGASPVHSSALSQRSCRRSFSSSQQDGVPDHSEGGAFSGRPRATSKVVRRLHFSDAEQAATTGVRWERTGARLARAVMSGSDLQYTASVEHDDGA